MATSCAELKRVGGSGLLAFPVTHFDSEANFDETPYRASIGRNIENGAAALFAPGGTGEFFSLTLREFQAARIRDGRVESSHLPYAFSRGA